MRYRTKLNTDSIKKTIDSLERFKTNLVNKCDMFCRKLGEKGIRVSENNSGEYAKYLIFTCELKEKTSDKVIRIYTARKKSDITVTWHNGSAQVDPLLMAEFGSGWKADNKWGVEGVGQGTFPNQKHAKDPQGWFWVDNDGETHHSMGQNPTYPVYYAYLAMEGWIEEVAKEVFGK